MKSLRARVVLAVSLTFCAILLCLGIALDAAVRHAVTDSFDASLVTKAKALALAVEQHDEKLHFEFEPQDMPEFSAMSRPAFFEIWTEGDVLAKSPSLRDSSLPDPTSLNHKEVRALNIWLPDGRQGRVVVFPFQAYIDEDRPLQTPRKTGVVEVAVDTTALRMTLARVRETIVIFSLLAVGLAGVLLTIVISSALRPLNRVADHIARVQPSELSKRIDILNVPSEVEPLVDRLNELLGRLELAFEREKAFSADAAHELRTPVSALRTMMQVCLSRWREPADYITTLSRCLAVTTSMQTLTENLLMLARAEAEEPYRDSVTVDLARVVREVWNDFKSRLPAAELIVSWDILEHVEVQADPDNLRLVLSNLFDNVLSHSIPQAKVRISLVIENETPVLSIANQSSDITSADAEMVFERLWRKEESRSATGAHAGIGLSLCKRLVQLFGGRITAKVQDDIFTVEVAFPRQCVTTPEPSPKTMASAACSLSRPGSTVLNLKERPML